MALYEIIRSTEYEAAGLITTVTEGYDRISMHGVRKELLERQAEALNVPLKKIWISKGATNDEYKAKMHAGFLEFQEKGISSVVFGDLFLQDIKRYREELLSEIDMKAIFPIWMRNTTNIVRDFIRHGFKAIVVCTDPRALDASFTGRTINEEFLRDLPSSVDPCGENGEFHSFVFDGPLFKQRIHYNIGEIVARDNFHFCDLMPA